MKAAGAGLATPAARWRRRMLSRDSSASLRASTNLELLFDLTFVVAVSQAAHGLAEHLVDGHLGSGVLGYVSVFFAVWWAWVNFTWFASAFDTDDVPYRLLTLLQMTGVLILAAGVPAAFGGDFHAVTVGYVVMRLAMIVQWLRASFANPEFRSTCLRYAAGIAIVQVGWVVRLALPHSTGWLTFTALALAEMSVPYWAERTGMTRWHPVHIAERYGLFTIIVLGEGISQVGMAIQTSFTATGVTVSLVVGAAEGLVLLFAMWWIYFARESGDALRERTDLSFFWGYGHYLVFAAVPAVAAALDVAVTAVGDASADVRSSQLVIALAVAVPVAVYLVALGAMMGRLHGDLIPKLRRVSVAAVLTVLLALLARWVSLSVVGALLALPTVVLVVEEIVIADQRARPSPAQSSQAEPSDREPSDRQPLPAESIDPDPTGAESTGS